VTDKIISPSPLSISGCKINLSFWLPSVWQQVELAVGVARLAVVTWWKIDSADDGNDKLVQCHVVKQFHL